MLSEVRIIYVRIRQNIQAAFSDSAELSHGRVTGGNRLLSGCGLKLAARLFIFTLLRSQ